MAYPYHAISKVLLIDLAAWYNSIYLNKFLKTLKEKAFLKLKKFPENGLSSIAISSAVTFEDFDNAVTAPLFGFKNAKDYWEKSSCKQFITAIDRPSLLINAQDDTFISKSCFPFDEAKINGNFYLETPKYGGHVGFNSIRSGKKEHWSENRILNFVKHTIS